MSFIMMTVCTPKRPLKKMRSCLAIYFVTLSFQLMYFHQMIIDVPRSIKRGHQWLQFLGHLLDDPGEHSHIWGVFLNAVPYHGAGESFNEVNYSSRVVTRA